MRRRMRFCVWMLVGATILSTGVVLLNAEAYQIGSTSPKIKLPDSISVEHVKQWLIAGLDWLAHAIVWFFTWLSAVIIKVVEFIAHVIVIIVKALMRLITTIFELLR